MGVEAATGDEISQFVAERRTRYPHVFSRRECVLLQSSRQSPCDPGSVRWVHRLCDGKSLRPTGGAGNDVDIFGAQSALVQQMDGIGTGTERQGAYAWCGGGIGVAWLDSQ